VLREVSQREISTSSNLKTCNDLVLELGEQVCKVQVAQADFKVSQNSIDIAQNSELSKQITATANHLNSQIEYAKADWTTSRVERAAKDKEQENAWKLFLEELNGTMQENIEKAAGDQKATLEIHKDAFNKHVKSVEIAVQSLKDEDTILSNSIESSKNTLFTAIDDATQAERVYLNGTFTQSVKTLLDKIKDAAAEALVEAVETQANIDKTQQEELNELFEARDEARDKERETLNREIQVLLTKHGEQDAKISSEIDKAKDALEAACANNSTDIGKIFADLVVHSKSLENLTAEQQDYETRCTNTASAMREMAAAVQEVFRNFDQDLSDIHKNSTQVYDSQQVV